MQVSDLITVDGRLRGKTPDPEFHVKISDFGIRKFLKVVFEVGYLESHSHLLADVHHWLMESQGESVLCVIIFVFQKPLSAFNFFQIEQVEDLFKGL